MIMTLPNQLQDSGDARVGDGASGPSAPVQVSIKTGCPSPQQLVLLPQGPGPARAPGQHSGTLQPNRQRLKPDW